MAKQIIDKQLGQEITDLEERKSFLRANCEGIETLDYLKRYSPETITRMKSDLSDQSIIINDIQTEKKETMKAYKDQLKPLLEGKTQLLQSIKSKAEMVNEPCYKFLNEELRMACFYNADGDLVNTRPFTQDEMQKNIFQIEPKTGTNN